MVKKDAIQQSFAYLEIMGVLRISFLSKIVERKFNNGVFEIFSVNFSDVWMYI